MASAHDAIRYQCVDALIRCYVEMAKWSPLESPHMLARCGRQRLQLYVPLRRESDDDLLWCTYAKHHLFIHRVEQSLTNPHKEWNYGDESEIGSAVESAATVNASWLSTKLIEQYRRTFQIEGC